MTAELRPYPNYKETGLSWLGPVPAHWDIRRNGRLFAQRNETGFGSLPILEVSLKTGVRVRDMKNMKRKQVMTDREKYKKAVQGDIAYNMMRMWQGALGAVPVDGLVSPAYVVARPSADTETRYFSYLFRTAAYMAEVDGYSRGIVKDRNRLYWEDFKRMPSCYPPSEEQTCIADYLDANALLVRNFIRNRRRLIAVLNEQKQAIINKAVIRGLHPGVPLKSSRIGWLGLIPQHWEIWQIGHLAQVGNGSTPSRSNMAYWIDGDFPWLNSGSVNEPTITRANRFVTKRALRECHLPLVTQGSVLIAITGQGKTRGKASVLQLEATINQHLVFITPITRVRPEFLQAFLVAAYPELRRISDDSGSTKGALTCADVRRFRVAIPPENEQREIIGHVVHKTHDVETAIQTGQREIDLVREYRNRLVSDVVTGKLDVRHLAPPPGSLDLDESDIRTREQFTILRGQCFSAHAYEVDRGQPAVFGNIVATPAGDKGLFS